MALNKQAAGLVGRVRATWWLALLESIGNKKAAALSSGGLSEYTGLQVPKADIIWSESQARRVRSEIKETPCPRKEAWLTRQLAGKDK